MLFGKKKRHIRVDSAVQLVPRGFLLWEKKSKSEANDIHTNLRPRLRMSGTVRPKPPTPLTCVRKFYPHDI